jgi:2-oxoglutarate dehydrogenase E2 component (dihydrolipoamide succinyltransferase)
MDVEIKVPQLGESVTEATIAKWYKKPGESVKADELLVELETDKVTMEVNAPTSGVLKVVKKATGEVVTPSEIIGSIEAGAVAETPATSQAEPASSNVQAAAEKPLSPAVRKTVEEKNIDPATITGTGKDGRITKGDLIAPTTSVAVSKPASAAPQNNMVISGEKPVERVRMSRLRKRIAERLKDSQNTAAMLTTFNEVDMGYVMNMRNQYKDNFEKKHGVKLGFMSFFVKAAIAALQEIPAVNGEIEGDDIIYKHFYDIGVAVGTEQGLVVPVIRDADRLSFAEIEKTIGGLGKKAREGKLSMEDLSGGTFTISNGGTYGSLLSTPIINPPQSGILGMHKIQERPMVIGGKIEIRPMMYLALTYDHRIIDGKEAVTFLVRIKELIEAPERLLLSL